MSDSPEIVCVRESLSRTIVNDAVDCGSLLAMTGIGVWLESSALQWVGALMFIMVIFDRTIKTARRARKTPQQAADWLMREYGVVAIRSAGADGAAGSEP